MKLTNSLLKTLIEGAVAKVSLNEAQVYNDPLLGSFDKALIAVEELASVTPASEPFYDRLVAIVDELEKIHSEYSGM